MLIKKVICLFVVALILSCFFLPTEKVSAQSDAPIYVRVRDKNVFFYSAPNDESILFALVPTYYLKVLGQEGNYLRVEIMEESAYFSKIIGYVLAESVEEIFTSPLLPLYPTEIISVTSSSARIYAQPSLLAEKLVTATNGQKMGYYGKVISDQTVWYYVCYGEYLGYVNENYLSMPNLTAHPTPLSVKTVEVDIGLDVEDTPAELPVDSPADTSELWEQPTLTILIILIALPVVVLIILLFLPDEKRKAKVSYVDLTTADRTAPTKPRYFDDYI